MKKKNLKNATLRLITLVFGAIMVASFNACDKMDSIGFYEPGKIPGLGETPGEVSGNQFTLPDGIELTGDITGSASSSNYWNQSSGGQTIHYYGSGYGYVDLLLKLRNIRSTPITVTFPAATVFISKTGSTQNGVLLQKVTITIPANSDYHLCLSLYCGNEHKGAAGSGSIYRLGVVSNAVPLTNLCFLLQIKKINIEKFLSTSTTDKNIFTSQKNSLQRIVWRITDGNGLSQSDIDYINSLPISLF